MTTVPQRVWARTPPDEFGNQTWVCVVPDPQTGSTDLLYFAALAQCLRLNLGESPFYASSGLPARQSVATQIPPDIYVARIQTQYSQYFASLVLSKVSTTPLTSTKPYRPVPTYRIFAVAHSGTVLNADVPVAT
jgi:hypothetical protein